MEWLKKHVVILFAIVLAAFIIWYHIPYSVNRAINLSTVDGKYITGASYNKTIY